MIFMAEFSLTIGEKIYIFRKRSGFSRKQLAQMLGVSVSTISNYENGVTLPDSRTLAAISSILEINIDNMLFSPKSDSQSNSAGSPILTRSQQENMI